MNERTIETRKGIKSRLLETGEGPPLVYLHGAGGLYEDEPLLEALAIGSTRQSGPATESPAARSCSRTCSISRCTAGTSSKPCSSRAQICWGTRWAA